jgi:hypothetical protein
VSEELELSAMRARFLEVSKEIAKDLLLLSNRMDQEPLAVRASLVVAAEEIATVQERLRIEVNQLAGALQQRVGTMEGVLQAQQAARLQLIGILERNTKERLTNLARLMNLARHVVASRLAEANKARQRARVAASLAEVSRAQERLAQASRVQEHLMSRAAQAVASIRRRHGHARHVRSTADLPSANDPKPVSVLAAIVKVGTSFSFMLVNALSIGLVVSYMSVPRDSQQQQMAAEPVLREPHAGGITAMPSPEGARIREQPAATRAEDLIPALQVPAPPSQPPSAPGDSADGKQLGVNATPVPATPVSNPAATVLSNGAERFVPVVFTHKDQRTAARAFADLKQLYPALLKHRQSEVLTVDIDNKGTWHRVVILPAGSRQEASEFCSRLGAAGYDRCWVKAY